MNDSTNSPENQCEACVDTFICAACHTSDHAPSAMQPALCTECVHRTLQAIPDDRPIESPGDGPSEDEPIGDWRSPADMPAALLALWRAAPVDPDARRTLCRRIASYTPAQFQRQIIDFTSYLVEVSGLNLSERSVWLIWLDFRREGEAAKPPDGPNYLAVAA